MNLVYTKFAFVNGNVNYVEKRNNESDGVNLVLICGLFPQAGDGKTRNVIRGFKSSLHITFVDAHFA